MLAACSKEAPPELSIDLRTDFQAGVDFTEVRVGLEPTGRIERVVLHRASPQERYLRGVRVAEYGDLRPGAYIVRVGLVRADRVVIERRVMLDYEHDLALTVVLTRDCLGAVCPGAGGDVSATECLGGRCVAPTCSSAHPELCPAPECREASDCASVDACVEGACVEGTCLRGGLAPACEVDAGLDGGDGGDDHADTCEPDDTLRLVARPRRFVDPQRGGAFALAEGHLVIAWAEQGSAEESELWWTMTDAQGQPIVVPERLARGVIDPPHVASLGAEVGIAYYDAALGYVTLIRRDASTGLEVVAPTRVAGSQGGDFAALGARYYTAAHALAANDAAAPSEEVAIVRGAWGGHTLLAPAGEELALAWTEDESRGIRFNVYTARASLEPTELVEIHQVTDLAAAIVVGLVAEPSRTAIVWMDNVDALPAARLGIFSRDGAPLHEARDLFASPPRVLSRPELVWTGESYVVAMGCRVDGRAGVCLEWLDADAGSSAQAFLPTCGAQPAVRVATRDHRSVHLLVSEMGMQRVAVANRP